jgi:decaprenyl-phosphate phosphoribosyltransferase
MASNPPQGSSQPPPEQLHGSSPMALETGPPVIPEFKEGTLPWRIRGLIKQMRPEQWLKNSFVLAPLVFAKHLNHPSIIISAVGGFGVFCLLASGIYTMNDLVDVEADRVHPKKRFRPIASGRVPIWAGKALASVLISVALVGAAIGPRPFLYTALAYLGLQVAYSFKLKKIAYLDVGCISLGFVLRVLAGSFAVRVPPSFYMLACTALLALFLGFGKRRHELAGSNAAKQRAALEQYSPRVLTIALAVTGVLTLGTYLAYTLDPATQAVFNSPWLWITTIHPVFGVIRFLQLVVSGTKSESPTQEILRDVPFMMNLVLYVIEVIVIIYQVRPGSV